MSKNPYERFKKEGLILRDELAIDRTRLANERTLLSYLRGAIALVIAGVTFVHFVEHGLLYYLGRALVPLGVIIGLYGIVRFRRMDKHIRAIRTDLDPGGSKE